MRNVVACALVLVILTATVAFGALAISLIALSRNDCYPPHKDDQVARFVLGAKDRLMRTKNVHQLIADIQGGGHGTNWGDLDLWVINVAERHMMPEPPHGQKPNQLTRMAAHSVIRQWTAAHTADPKATGAFVAFQDQTAPLNKPFTRRAYVVSYTHEPGGDHGKGMEYLIGSGYFVRRHCWYRNDYTHDPLGHD